MRHISSHPHVKVCDERANWILIEIVSSTAFQSSSSLFWGLCVWNYLQMMNETLFELFKWTKSSYVMCVESAEHALRAAALVCFMKHLTFSYVVEPVYPFSKRRRFCWGRTVKLIFRNTRVHKGSKRSRGSPGAWGIGETKSLDVGDTHFVWNTFNSSFFRVLTTGLSGFQ